ncbi:TPA: ABC transporter permease [Escherichia coli]|nr:ABC transporter permease [Escherichia coli]HBA8669834.1 ABC transporter permease [Escherichia coli]HBA8710138.1 ABC transporter permease [Escherichia coli]
MYLYEACQNLLENKRNIVVILIFFVLSFSGIAVTDSLIYSTAKKAEMELSLSGSNIATVDFNTKVSEKKIDTIFYGEPYLISKSKKVPFYTGTSPFSNEVKIILGTDKIKLSNYGLENVFQFENNMMIVTEGETKGNSKTFFLNGLPFNVVGELKNKKTDFLDSLGLSSFSDKFNYIIPIDTMFRMTLDDTIDTIDIKINKNIDSEDIIKINEKLTNNDVTDFSVRSVLDAKKSVENVLNKFSLLTNSVYILLTLMMLVIIITVCRRAFQSRSTEFALKVIHGIDKKHITRTVIVEMFLLTLMGVGLAVVFTIVLVHCLSLYIGIELFFRPVMILLSFLFVVFASYAVGIRSGIYFFKLNPVDLIKSRKQ